ncbi:MAG TPA: class I SAM-dependent methyltransferase [Candidatus Dormibacteraeota bacterium]|nr:class I SAM-dependent methyltransferase [Candidatus Dormibacteraeota bacterium]
MNGELCCRSCGAPLSVTFADLGSSPLSNSYIPGDRSRAMEPTYPLHAYVCERCFLVQLEVVQSREHIFSEYAYFSSYSDSWLAHSRNYAGMAIDRLGLTAQSLVIEAASNDGYLLQYFVYAGVRVLGVEPARNVAAVALDRGIATENVFLGEASGGELRRRYGAADLLIANNVIAHVPDVHDFFGGLAALLAERGSLTVEFPHLMRLIEGVEFDTIYHEHFSYYSLHSLEGVLEAHNLAAYDVEELSTHGGSLRVWIGHKGAFEESASLGNFRRRERDFGITSIGVYRDFSAKIALRKRQVLRFLLDAAEQKKSVVGYGAPAKGNTLLNYCGVGTDLLQYTVDRNPAKVGTLLPGSRIPVFETDRYKQTKPDYIFILPWNLRDEVVAQNAFAREWGARFVVAMPELEIF